MAEKRYATDTRDRKPPKTTPADQVPETAVLRRAVHVVGENAEPGPLRVLPAGTSRADIPDSELAQLCGEHFTEGA